MTLIEELRADEVPGDRQSVREARATLGGLTARAADRIDTLEAEVGRLREALTEAIEQILDLANARWSEIECPAEDLVSEFRAALKTKEQGEEASPYYAVRKAVKSADQKLGTLRQALKTKDTDQ